MSERNFERWRIVTFGQEIQCWCHPAKSCEVKVLGSTAAYMTLRLSYSITSAVQSKACGNLLPVMLGSPVGFRVHLSETHPGEPSWVVLALAVCFSNNEYTSRCSSES